MATIFLILSDTYDDAFPDPASLPGKVDVVLHYGDLTIIGVLSNYKKSIANSRLDLAPAFGASGEYSLSTPPPARKLAYGGSVQLKDASVRSDDLEEQAMATAALGAAVGERAAQDEWQCCSCTDGKTSAACNQVGFGMCAGEDFYRLWLGHGHDFDNFFDAGRRIGPLPPALYPRLKRQTKA
ncbi:hypothetical protein B0T26DRAFT_746588 [Lasiosphaeria miniovina]|uniref:Uncharacterized protein n=1 Tax=Lasiosphaeria miniovina TaxID=1954250 RepID=A0AA40BIA0_9PEZI|nr:uncharacterized protein B0T26DRAFT_746588 [Lasiosphaeria miniovina]KAK0734717.1 hypothetical protein B0T26DRAFT_746588 [Lasiosphaeria miniovina]